MYRSKKASIRSGSHMMDKKLALHRINLMLMQARKMIKEDERLAQRYIDLARRISMVSRVRIGREHRHLICRGCKRLIIPGVNCIVRIRQHREPHIVVSCSYCGKHRRVPLLTSRARARDRASRHSTVIRGNYYATQ